MINSPGFNANLFKKLVYQWAEGPRLDYKVRIFGCENDEEKFKFVKILIALANISRRIGKPCWILFGVKDKTKGLEQVRDQYVGKKRPEFWDDPLIDIHIKQSEGVADKLRQIARNWITPDEPEFTLEYGEVDNTFVSYIEIQPTYPTVPYALKKKYVGFEKGTVFIRKGSSSLPIPASQVSQLVPYSEVEYLKRLHWNNIFNHYQSGDFLSVENVTPYIDTGVQQSDQLSAKDLILENLNLRKKIILIKGGRGEGKTFLLYKLAFSIATLYNKESSTSNPTYAQNVSEGEIRDVIEELEVYPPTQVPIFFHLRTTFSSSSEIESQLTKVLADICGKENIRGIKNVFNIPSTKWILFLDGIDEIRNKEKAGPILSAWINSLPKNVQVVISSRPESIQNVNPNKVVELRQLNDEMVNRFIELTIQVYYPDQRNELLKKITDWLLDNKDIYPVIRNFRALKGFIDSILAVTRITIPIDKENIKVIKPEIYSSNLYFNNPSTGVLPKTSTDSVIETEQTEYEPPSTQEETDNEEFVLPTRAIALQKIIDYIIEEEQKRQADFGNSPSDSARRARWGLKKTAWMSDWNSESFNIDICIQKRWISCSSFGWNRIAGFIQPANANRLDLFKFYCSTLRHYFAAEYAIDYYIDIFRLKQNLKRKITNEVKNNVIAMINEIRIENGLSVIEIDF